MKIKRENISLYITIFFILFGLGLLTVALLLTGSQKYEFWTMANGAFISGLLWDSIRSKVFK